YSVLLIALTVSRPSVGITLPVKPGLSQPSVHTLIRALTDERPKKRQDAADRLCDMGREAAEAVPALIRVLKQDHIPEVRAAAAFALGRIAVDPETVVPPLLQGLMDTNKDVRIAAVVALGYLGPRAKSAVRTLIAANKRESKEVSRWIIITLGKIG